MRRELWGNSWYRTVVHHQTQVKYRVMANVTAVASPTASVFVAALNGDFHTIKTLLPAEANASTPEGYTPLSLAVSAQHMDVVRLLLREGAQLDAQDQDGVSALMHACMHGNAELTDLLLLHGARTELRNHQGETAASLAARYGRPASLGALFRADPSLVESTDGAGRTPLHWAAVSRHAPTVKYLLGRWEARVEAVDAEGNTPLHLVESQRDVALLLLHGSGSPPPRTERNLNGQTAAEAAEAVGASHVAEMLAPGGSDADGPWSIGELKLFSFLNRSPARRPPATTPPPSWVVNSSASHALVALSLVVAPKALSMGYGFSTALSSSVGLLLLAGAMGFVRDRWFEETGGSRKGAAATAAPVSAAILVGAVTACGYVHCAALVPQATLGVSMLATYGTVAALGGFWYLYTRVQRLDPGLLPGADPSHASRYWTSLERLQAGASSPLGVCERSELFLPPRAAYSKLSGGAIRAMDHDCPWVARCIGANNHAAFVGMLLFGELAIVLSELSMLWIVPPYPLHSWTDALSAESGLGCMDNGTDAACALAAAPAMAHARLALSGVPLLILLQAMLTPLLVCHVFFACANVTTREHFHWVQSAQATRGNRPSFPMPGSPHWRLYAPYDRGIWRNLLAFARGTRDAAHADGNSPSTKTTLADGVAGAGDHAAIPLRSMPEQRSAQGTSARLTRTSSSSVGAESV